MGGGGATIWAEAPGIPSNPACVCVRARACVCVNIEELSAIFKELPVLACVWGRVERGGINIECVCVCACVCACVGGWGGDGVSEGEGGHILKPLVT